MGGGIIISRAKALLTAVLDPSLYGSLTWETKAVVDGIEAKDPDTRTEQDVELLYEAIGEALGK